MKSRPVVLRPVICIAVAVLSVSVLHSEPITDTRLFSDSPDDVPKLFGPGIVSLEDRNEYGFSLSPEGGEFFFTADAAPAGVPKGLMVMRKYMDGTWSSPVVADLRKSGLWEFEAFHSPDDKDGRLRLWPARKEGECWGIPVQIDGPIAMIDAFWPRVSSDGTLYYTDIFRAPIFRASFQNGGYPAPEKMSFSRGIIHPSISPDGSYLLCNSNKDIFVAFRNAYSGWSFPMSLGSPINTSEFDEGCASVTPDGRHIFFSRYDDKAGKCNIYWVNSSVVESLRPR